MGQGQRECLLYLASLLIVIESCYFFIVLAVICSDKSSSYHIQKTESNITVLEISDRYLKS